MTEKTWADAFRLQTGGAEDCNRFRARLVFSDMDEERRLVAEVIAGRRGAFESLIRRYEKLVAHIVGRMLSDIRDREEIAQDVFLQVHRQLHTFDFRSRLAAWISQITYRRCINRLKQRGVSLMDDVDADTSGVVTQDSGDEILERVSTEVLRARLRVLIEELPVQWRAVITLHYTEGMHITEIEEVTGIPAGTVKSYLHRARARLREQLTKGQE